MRELTARAYQCSKNHGFWDGLDPMNPLVACTKIALICSEAGEAVEAIRNEDNENLGEELADIVIRCMDLAEARGLNLAAEVSSKIQKNEGRPHGHNRKVRI